MKNWFKRLIGFLFPYTRLPKNADADLYCPRPDIERAACEWPDCGRTVCRHSNKKESV